MTCLAAMLSSCSLQKDAQGGELIKKAREDYVSLDSARVVMTNMDTGEAEQEFTFKYDEKDVLIFSYYGKNGNEVYAQFNNGAECFTYDNGEYTYVSKGDKGFSQYTRQLTHPQADKGLLIYTPGSIIEATADDENGITHICHKYDVDKIGAAAANGSVTAFTADYYFEGEELLYFTETTETDNGDTYAYRVDITEKNAVDKVENTTAEFKDK